MRVCFEVPSPSNLHKLAAGVQNSFALRLLGRVPEFHSRYESPLRPQIDMPQSANWCMQST